MASGGLPFELQGVPPDVLERYVRGRVLALAGSASIAKRLGVGTESLRQAFAESLAEAAALRSHGSEAEAGGPPLQLTFGHDCQHLGCLEAGCALCAQNPNRRCSGSFAAKYLSGDVLKATCGASIRVQVVDRRALEPAKGRELDGIALEMCVVDGRAYQALVDAGRETSAADVEACILATNNQGRELLVPGRGASHNDAKWVVCPLVDGTAHLPDLSVTGSSEALLSGQKPPFRLLVRAVAADGSRAEHIRFIVSDAFVVATPRVRTAAKAEIPHLDDHVSKLHAVGNMTQSKLLDIQGAAAAVGIYSLQVPHNSVTKVGQFRELVEVAERDAQLCEALKKVLKLTRGWEVARDHARTAVATDNRMRVWTADARGSGGGLLFKCHLGSVELDSPVGLLNAVEGAAGPKLEAVLVARLPPSEKDRLRRLQRQAAVCWWQLGHPGWAVWPVDTQAFLQDVAAPGAQPRLDGLIGAGVADGGRPAERPLTRATAQQTGLQPGDAQPSLSDSMAPQPARSGTPSEGAASLDGWVGTARLAPPQARGAGGGGVGGAQQSDLQFPWLGEPVHAALPQERPGGHFAPPANAPPATAPPGRAPADFGWASPPPLPGNGAAAGGGSAGLYAAWRQEADSLPSGGGGLPSGEHWGLPPPAQLHAGFPADLPVPNLGAPGRFQPHHHLPAYSRAASMGSGGSLPQPAMPSSGNVRKREPLLSSLADMGGAEAEPLPSPFGLPELQAVDVPQLPPPVPASRALDGMHARLSSGMEPAAAKRRHLSPAELQQQLSHLVGRPLGAQEMSLIIPNFPDLVDGPSMPPDLPSMTLTTSDLQGLMDSMLEPRPPGGAAPQAAPGARAAQQQQQQREAAAGRLPASSYTYADLSEAVGAVHGQRCQGQAANAPLDRPRTSSMLMDYLASRLSTPDQPQGEDLAERKSGLDTMPQMLVSLPPK